MVRHVTIKKFSEETGYTVNAIYQKIKRRDWLEGSVWKRAPDGRVLIDKEGYEKWVNEQELDGLMTALRK